LDETSLSPDLDGDTLPDCVDDDIDGDGYSNDEEIACGSDPYDPLETCATIGIQTQKPNGLKIYPNPTSELLTLNSESPLDGIYIYTVNGILVYENSKPGTHQTIDLSSFERGVYILHLQKQESTEQIKIIKN
jgi:hypothetical protein